MRQRHGAVIARREKPMLSAPAALPDRADGVNDISGRQAISARDPDIARRASVQGAALDKQLRPGGTMNRAVNTASTEQGFIRSVDDRINAQRRDIGNDDLEPRRTDVAFDRRQAAGAPTVTPLSANIC